MKIFTKDVELQNRLLNRFIRYVKIWSESDSNNADKGIQPSTKQQKAFAQILSKELKSIGLKNVSLTSKGYLYGILPATKGMENFAPFLMLAHMDTVDEVTGKDVKPIIHAKYDGAKIDLKCGVTLDISEDDALALAAKEEDTIITSDGSTLLGADDKAGIAAIISCLEYIKEHKEIKHGPIEVIFSPDEETGHGMDNVPLDLIKSKFAYTVDGGHIGELETECFNAFAAKIIFKGKSTHTGDARKLKMVNACCVASRFIENLPAGERPETTDGYDGFYAVMNVQGAIETCEVNLLLRDFTEKGMQQRIETVKKIAVACAESSGAKVDVEFKEQYKNMKTNMDKAPFVVQNLEAAYKACGVEPVYKPIRGGTDGSRLTEMGIPCPNIFTGGHNYHSRSEWASLSQMCASTDVLINLVATVVLAQK